MLANHVLIFSFSLFMLYQLSERSSQTPYLSLGTCPPLSHLSSQVPAILAPTLVPSKDQQKLYRYICEIYYFRNLSWLLCYVTALTPLYVLGAENKAPSWCYQRPYIRETMHSALNLQCTLRAQLISATRGRASQPKVLAMATDCSATCQQG